MTSAGQLAAGPHVPGVTPGTALAVEHLSKTFGTTRALDDVRMAIGHGRIHGLVGGNGSGKSTLIKILAGVHHGDAGGEIRVGARAIAADAMTPERARDCGLRFVHQDPGVFPTMTVAENLAIGGADDFPTRGGRVRWSQLRLRTQALLDRFAIDAAPDDRLGDLRQAERTMVAIARALGDPGERDEPLLLVLDEPTASLPQHEVEVLLDAIRRCACAGQSILYVSHRLEEVLSLVDDLTVLRDGRVAANRDARGLTTDELVEAIMGRPLERVFGDQEPRPAGATRLAVRGLRGGPLRDVSFELGRGEIVGIAGLLGSGRTELLQLVFGVLPPDAGSIELDGVPLDGRSPAAAMRAGVALVPEDRARDAAFPELSVTVNLSAAQIGRYRRWVRLDTRAERRDAARSIDAFSIRAPGAGAPLAALSGGNQQKVVLARWLRRSPRLLLLDEPTQGVDVGARAELYALVRAAAGGGTSTLVVSSDLEELAHVADRVLVLRDGRILAEVRAPELTAHRLTDLLYAEDRA
jgi:ribose transport system ATP-binding protein